MKDRFSEAEEAILVTDENERAKLEAKNALLQADEADALLKNWLQLPAKRLKVYDILSLHRILMTGLSEYAGNYRPAKVKIRGSRHTPPSANDVPRLMEEMCEYISDNWERATSLHLCAYALWRINWIHPFSDGNGRTARVVSYLILSAHSGRAIPGDLTIPEQIVKNKQPYYKALEPADKAFLSGKIDLKEMEQLIGDYLANQLYDYYKSVTGTTGDSDLTREIESVLSEAQVEGAKDRSAIAEIPSAPQKGRSKIIEENQGLIAIMGIIVAIILFLIPYFTKK